MSELVQQGPLALFFAMTIGHALADYPLQGSYLSTQKNRHLAAGPSEWLVAVLAHSLIHAGAVWWITGSMMLAVVELLLHSLIDLGKCERKYGLLADQGLHLLCKAAYAWAVATGAV